MNPAVQKQIYDQVGLNDYPLNSFADFSKSDLFERVREQRQRQEIGQTVTIQNSTASSRISSRLEDAIQLSRNILNLNDDWDEEGSKGYAKDTWDRTVAWVKKSTQAFRNQRGFWVDPPRILPGPEGSIDIHWKTSKRELLINVPENLQEPADYYGCGEPKDTVKGKFDTSLSNEWILVWLTK